MKRKHISSIGVTFDIICKFCKKSRQIALAEIMDGISIRYACTCGGSFEFTPVINVIDSTINIFIGVVEIEKTKRGLFS